MAGKKPAQTPKQQVKPTMQGKPAEWVAARLIEPDDVIARPNMPTVQPQRIGEVSTTAEGKIRLKALNNPKSWDFDPDTPVLRRVVAARAAVR